MKKAMLIIILSAMLTACGMTENTAKEEPIAVTSAVSQTTTTDAETASKTVTTSETTTTTKAVTTAETTSTSKAITTSKTETTTSKSTTRKAVSETTTTRQPIPQTETYIIYYDEPSPETQQTQPEVRVTETKPITTTTVQTTPPTTTTTSPPTTTTTAPPSGIEWSESMKVWRKLCEGKKLSGSEQDIIRNEILDYAVSSFNGKKDIHVSFGIDSYDISYEKLLNLTINRSMIGMENAHMDAYADANRKAMINYASSEQEIYDIVSDTRRSCLHVIDYGLFGRWEIMSMNGSLKYASDIEFNVGFDDEMTIWFLTQD